MALPVSPLRLEFLSGLAPSHILDKDLIPLFKLKETMYNQKNNEGQEDDTIEPLVKHPYSFNVIAGTVIFYKYAKKWNKWGILKCLD